MIAWTLRPVAATDAAAVSALSMASKASWGYDAAFMAACRDELTWSAAELASATGRVAESADGTLLGVCLVAPAASGQQELDALFIAEAAQGQGVGTALFRAAADLARAAGATVLEIVADPNAASIYAHWGATLVGERPSGSIPGRMLPLYALDLSDST